MNPIQEALLKASVRRMKAEKPENVIMENEEDLALFLAMQRREERKAKILAERRKPKTMNVENVVMENAEDLALFIEMRRPETELPAPPVQRRSSNVENLKFENKKKPLPPMSNAAGKLVGNVIMENEEDLVLFLEMRRLDIEREREKKERENEMREMEEREREAKEREEREMKEREKERELQLKVPVQSQLVGMNLENVMMEHEEDLGLYFVMQGRDKESSNLLGGSDDSSEHKNGGSPVFKSIPSPLKKSEDEDILNSESDKHDYDWLLAAPGSPSFPSLETESEEIVTADTGTPKARATELHSKLADHLVESSSRNKFASRHSISSPGVNSSNAEAHRPSSSGGRASVSSRPAISSGRAGVPLPAKSSRLSTSSRATLHSSKPMGSSARPSTPSARSSKPAERSSTASVRSYTAAPRSSTASVRSYTPAARSSTASVRSHTPAAKSSTTSVRSAARSSTASVRSSAPVGRSSTSSATARPSTPSATARPSTPSGRLSISSAPAARLSTSSARSSTPVAKSSVPSSRSSTGAARLSTSSARSSTSAAKLSTSSVRSSTSAGRPPVPAPSSTSRPGTPTKRPSTPPTLSSVSVPPRGSIPAVKSRLSKSSEIPGFSVDAPQRTSVSRQVSYSRGRPGSPSVRPSTAKAGSNGRLGRQSRSPTRGPSSTKAGSNGELVACSPSRGPSSAKVGSSRRLGRQSCSPTRGQLQNGSTCSNRSSFSAVRPTHSNGSDNVNHSLIGTKMVERVVTSHKLAPPKKDEHTTHSTGRLSLSHDSSGYGRTISKTSLDMALRHMDISLPGKSQPARTNVPDSSMLVRSGSSRSKTVNFSDSLGASSNAKSKKSNYLRGR